MLRDAIEADDMTSGVMFEALSCRADRGQALNVARKWHEGQLWSILLSEPDAAKVGSEPNL
ncbi:hypothetical protein V8J82_23085 [Gymnodinialimonas sp. 2305UL16-5]|uniref:hypothetical protein n=1 Tax=Gymnodinialimonas mytili TaxID=3126503 RepID=UPI0030AC87B9